MDITRTNETDLGAFVDLLKEQRTRMLDLIVPGSKITAEGGQIRVAGAEVHMGDDGVTDPNGLYKPTRVAHERIGEKLGIHGSYMQRMIERGRADIWDANVNGWLQGDGGEHGPDGRNFLARCYRGDTTGEGIIRALLSDKFMRVDNLDVLTSVMLGLRSGGLGPDKIEVNRCDITERNMYVKVSVPGIAAWAPGLLAGYRNPFGMELNTHGWTLDGARAAAQREGQGYEPGQEPVLFAGVAIRNSETGDGGFTISPELTVRICGNRLTFTADAVRRTHLGGRMNEGLIEFSEETQRKELELVALKTRDAVGQFLSADYVEGKVAELEKLAGVEVDKPAEVIAAVAKQAAFPAELEDEILGMFVKGGQATAGGVMQAVSAVAQRVDDAELAALLEAEAPKCLALAARAAA
jgi:hypothetical protein